MNTCATCKHYRILPKPAVGDDHYNELNELAWGQFGLGECSAVRFFSKAVIHSAGGMSLSDADAVFPAFVQDGEGYSAHLLTRPAFGCVMHEAKESA